MKKEQQKLKKNIEKIEFLIQNKKADQKIKDYGICALSIFSVLSNISEINEEKNRNDLWNNIKNDVISLNEELEKILCS